MTTRTQEEFVALANIEYSNKYSYNKTEYVNNYTKVTITCPEHGDFQQTPLQHLRGNGCTCCGKLRQKEKRKEAFLAAAENLHKRKYTYNLGMYTTNRVPIEITCPTHGTFTQTPSNHLKGHGCRECQYSHMGGLFRKPLEVFIEESSIVHNNKYLYTSTNYRNSHSKVSINCPTHGTFEQIAGHHVRGVGCPKCNPSGFNTGKPGLLYYLSINDGECFKIGITNLSVIERYTSSELAKISILEEALYPSGQDALDKEQEILKKYKHYQHLGSAPLKSGNTELFTTNLLSLKENHEINSIREL